MNWTLRKDEREFNGNFTVKNFAEAKIRTHDIPTQSIMLLPVTLFQFHRPLVARSLARKLLLRESKISQSLYIKLEWAHYQGHPSVSIVCRASH